jgi:hypothetical protein
MHNDPFNPPAIKTKWNVMNLGAGVQSSTLALMAAKGLVTPMPDFAVFADTQAEPTNVYKWLDWLETQLPFPVIRVTNGNLTEESLRVRLSGKSGANYLRRLIPVFGIMPNGNKTAAIGRKCTADFKVQPIIKHIREACGITRGQKELTVTQWIGISYDEMQRARLPSHAWTQHRWPLIEMKMRREHCIKWMLDNGYPEPPRSACYYCPFHSNQEWQRLKTEDPEHFAKAVEFDKTIRQAYKDHDQKMQMTIYLHNECKPLDEIQFEAPDDGQQQWDFKSECEGMCGL